MIVIDRNAIRMVELAWFVAFLAELGHERAAIIIITREYLHSIVSAIDNEQETSMMVERHTSRAVEQAISSALLPGADRELDSSITIKSIVFHLFHFNLSSLSQRQRDDPSSKLRKARATQRAARAVQRRKEGEALWLWFVAVQEHGRRLFCFSPAAARTSHLAVPASARCRTTTCAAHHPLVSPAYSRSPCFGVPIRSVCSICSTYASCVANQCCFRSVVAWLLLLGRGCCCCCCCCCLAVVAALQRLISCPTSRALSNSRSTSASPRYCIALRLSLFAFSCVC